MRIIGREVGRVVHLLVPEEVRPTHGWDLPALYRAVVSRYGFARSPDNFATFNQPDGARFETGNFVDPVGGERIPIAELLLFNDGIIGVCADTILAEALIDDVMKYLIDLKLLYQPTTSKPRTYFGSVIIQFDKIPPGGLEHMFSATSRFDAALTQHYGKPYVTSLTRLAFGADPLRSSPHGQAALIVERRVNTPYDQNWFWSSATLSFDIHIPLLEALEQDLMIM